MHAAPAVREDLLTGRRGWTTVLALATALVLIVLAQLSGAAVAQAGSPTLAVTASSATSLVPAERDRPVAAVVAARAATAAQEVRTPAPAVAALTAPQTPAAPAATAPSGDLCSGDGWQQRRGVAAMASLGPAADRSGFRVEFAPARSGYMGLTHLQENLVEVFVRGCDVQSDELLRHVIAHELGHAFDTARMDDAGRAAWKAARGIPATTPWYGCSGCSDFATPAGDFAEVYAQWLRGADSNRSELAGDVPAGALQELAARFFQR